MRRLGLILATIAGIGSAGLAAGAPDQGGCLAAIDREQQRQGTPPLLLNAIAVVESGSRDPATGRIFPWPWSVNVDGKPFRYDTKADAVAAVTAFQAGGAHSIDVGCMQINLGYHPAAFVDLNEAFDPGSNVAYAARFLRALFSESGNWTQAIGAYHSRTAPLGEDYQRRVMALLTGADWLDAPAVPKAGGPTHPAFNPGWAPALTSYQRELDEDRRRIMAQIGGGPLPARTDRRLLAAR